MTAERRGERGAALVSVLLLSILLLTAGGALVLTTTMSATNAIDSTAEMQAYYGAEAGLQAAINIVRGNVWSSDATPDVSFRAVVEPAESNLADDEATDSNVARLSNWLTYNANDRVVVPNTSGLIAYAVSVRDVDDSKTVSYSTSATFDVGSSGCTAVGTVLTCTGSGVNAFTLTYTPQTTTALVAYPAVDGSGLGKFTLTRVASGATIANDKPVRLRLVVNQTLPWVAQDTWVATITGDVAANTSSLQVKFSGSSLLVDGTKYKLCATCSPLNINHPVPVPGGETTLTATVTAPQPKRILVRSTGYGPKGAIKKLEMVLNQKAFDFEAPAVLTMRGSDDGSALNFDSGSSGSKKYTGVDHAGFESQLPAFAVSGGDVTSANTGIKKHDTVADPELGYLDNSSVPTGSTVTTMQVSTPDFLRTAQDARDALDVLETTASNLNRYYTTAADAFYTVNASNTTPTGITFVDGNCNLDGGSGLLVVTGTLQIKGNPNFNGVLLVLGKGVVDRSGGGEGTIYGAMVVASFDRDGTGGFTAPTYLTDGGGDSTFQFDSDAVSKALGAIGASPGGVREF